MRLKYLKNIYIDKIVKTCIIMCVCIIEFVVVLFKMSCNALSVVSGTCLFADCNDCNDQLGRNM
jgi:hypothetical protein